MPQIKKNDNLVTCKNVFGVVIGLKVSIKEVAKAAGVTAGTVSRAFNGYGDIREETKTTILKVAKELGYVPNLNAKRLSGKDVKTVAIILAGFMDDRGLTDELVTQLLRGACNYAIHNHMEFAVYVISSEQQKEKSFEQFCSEHSLSGAMCFGLRTTDAYYESLREAQVPCVTVDVLIEGEKMGYVGTDDVGAFAELTELVLRHQHRKIVFLNGRRDAAVCALRQKGLEQVLRQHGVQLVEMHYTDFNAEDAQAFVSDYISTHGRQEATAFLCASDLIALGTYNAVNRCGYQVGRDFSVTGYDGTNIARLIDPGITTIDQNMEKKGYAAAEMLHQIMEGRCTERKRIIPYTLLSTASVVRAEA